MFICRMVCLWVTRRKVIFVWELRVFQKGPFLQHVTSHILLSNKTVLSDGCPGVTCQDCFVCFAPHVFCDLVSPSCWLLIWFQVCLVISPLIVCVFKVQSIQFAFVGLWVSSLPVLPWCVTLLEIKDSSFVYSSSPRSWLPCSCVKRDTW